MDLLALGQLISAHELWLQPATNCGHGPAEEPPARAVAALPRGMRMYAKTGDLSGVEPWNRAVRTGATFVTSGPIIELSAEGAGPGETVCLSPDGG